MSLIDFTRDRRVKRIMRSREDLIAKISENA